MRCYKNSIFVYINQPMVKLVLLYIISLKVTEPIEDAEDCLCFNFEMTLFPPPPYFTIIELRVHVGKSYLGINGVTCTWAPKLPEGVSA